MLRGNPIISYIVGQFRTSKATRALNQIPHLYFHFPPPTQVTKRDEDSSLMQLKEEFRTYEALRREHDSQIVQIAMEGGLRIAPDQWSSLLYGDQSHKSHMQSIIDKVGARFLL